VDAPFLLDALADQRVRGEGLEKLDERVTALERRRAG
jgi:hypothetical protein